MTGFGVVFAKKYVNITGDFVLGALFPIHSRGSDSGICGEIQVSSLRQDLAVIIKKMRFFRDSTFDIQTMN